MIKIKSDAKGCEGYYNVYENHDEFEATGLTCKDTFADLKEGDYFQTRNGYYIPCIKIQAYDNGKFRRYLFPNARYTTKIGIKSGQWYTPKVVYEPRHKRRSRIVDGDQLLFVRFVFAGMSPTAAWGLITSARKKYPVQSVTSYFDMLQSDKIHKIIKAVMKEEMKVGLAKNKMDATWYAAQLKIIVEDSKANKDVRLHALQEVKSLIEDKSDVKSPELQTQMQNLKDKIIAKFDSTPNQMVS